jgi:poly(beta-D-mannuronate) lyase
MSSRGSYATVAVPAKRTVMDARHACPAPVARVEGRDFYSDARGSVIDPEKLREHLNLISPLRAFVSTASKWADSPDPDEQECGWLMMRAWAEGRALLQPPVDFIGQRERQRFTIALNIIALKLGACGFDICPALPWLEELNRGVMEDFEKHRDIGNLYVWSGVCAASYAVLNGDRVAKDYEDRVWQQSVGCILADGHVESEIHRGARALIYHAYYLSALLTLAAFRRAIGESASGRDHVFIHCLVAWLGRALYDPSHLAVFSGAAAQTVIPAEQLAPIIAWGADFLNPGFLSFAPADVCVSDPILGGDLFKTARILSDLGRTPT